ncbi:hypothetical protein [Massilibacteroides sp.]|uniref:hypothetical protein n=1 Tax=Massilibacteroides sp. TaxID=2034766 RepID=UPI0026022CB4|nr:hypothetical protein [Massilibacteroides sp.]MDD4516565.1 hypothetical protein [Massilibacteroides sp.]
MDCKTGRLPDYQVWKMMKYSSPTKQSVIEAALENPNYCLQLKKDGASYYLSKDPDGTAHLYKDSISKKTHKVIDKIENFPHLKKYVEDHFLPGSQVLVEILHGEDSKDVNRLCLANPDKAIRRQQEEGWATAYIFDILYWGNLAFYVKDFKVRLETYEQIFKALQNEEPFKYLVTAETVFENKKESLEKWLNSGEEGGVLKLLESTSKTSAAYQVRSIGSREARPANVTMKVKKVDTKDVVICGVTLPTPEFTGDNPDDHPYKDASGKAINRLYALNMISAFVVGAYKDRVLTEIGTISGMADETRLMAKEHPENFIGQVAEITMMSVDKEKQSFRHARLFRFRPDKPAEDCTFEEIFGEKE